MRGLYPADEELTLNKCKLPPKRKGIAYIYELVDPRNFIPKYVGFTKRGGRERLIRHITGMRTRKEKYTNKAKWIRELLELGLYPLMNVLEIVLEEDWSFWEIFWEETFISWGFKLENSVKCGRSNCGLKRDPKTQEEKNKQSAKLKEGFKTGRIRHPNKGKSMSEEQKELLRKNSSFHRLTPEQLKARAALTKSRGHKRNEEQLFRMKLGSLKKYISNPDYKCFVQLSDEGLTLGTFITLKEACECVYDGTKQSSGILVAIRDSKKCMGYRWRYGTEEETNGLVQHFLLSLEK